MSKPLTAFQHLVLDECEPDSRDVTVALVAAIARLEFLERKLRCAEDYLVPALMWYADGPQHQRADMALQAYNDVTE